MVRRAPRYAIRDPRSRSFGRRRANRVGSCAMLSPPQPHTHTVLLVEDDAGTREATRELLSRSGYAVVSAGNATAALILLRSEPRPCVIVLDLMMADFSGDDFRRAQLADRTVRDIPVLLVSGAHDLAARAQALGAAAFFAKPLGIAQLVAAIAHHCVAATAVA
ncbi:MAG: response regulator [Deltaproteobacteria bacterium]|nr:MAG: response regulator [Deltaproteobacteria bacterium]